MVMVSILEGAEMEEVCAEATVYEAMTLNERLCSLFANF